mgnify:FL=1
MDGVGLGASAKEVDTLIPYIKAAIEEGKKKGRPLTILMNWKAENNNDTGLEPLGNFTRLFKNPEFDWSMVNIAIATPNVYKVKIEMLKVKRHYWEQNNLSLETAETKVSESAASPLSVPEIKIKAKEAIVNAGESLQQYMFSDEAQNKYNLSAEYIDKLEEIKLWLWLENAIKFFDDRIKAGDFSPEAVSGAERIVSTYRYLIGELMEHASVTLQLIKVIYGMFKTRTIKSADDGEAILKTLLAMRKEENISKEELDIAIEILTPRQVDRVVPVWQIIKTLKQFSVGGIQNQEIQSIQMAILNVLIDDNYPGCTFLRKERLAHFLRYAETLAHSNYLDAETVSLIASAIKEKTYGKALELVRNLSKEKMGQASSEEVAELNRRQANVDIDNSIPTLGRIVEAYINNKDSLLSQEDKERVSNMYTASSTASPLSLEKRIEMANEILNNLKKIDPERSPAYPEYIPNIKQVGDFENFILDIIHLTSKMREN